MTNFTVMSECSPNVSPPCARRRSSGRRPFTPIGNTPITPTSASKEAIKPASSTPVRALNMDGAAAQAIPLPQPKAVAPKTSPPPKPSRASMSDEAILLSALVGAACALAILFVLPSAPPAQSALPSASPARIEDAAPEHFEAEVHVQATEMLSVESERADDEGAFSAVWSAEALPAVEELGGDAWELVPGEGFGEEGGEGEEDVEYPWGQAHISGPLLMGEGLMGEGMEEELAGVDLFARLVGSGELFLFAEAESETPLGMLLLDGCAQQHNVAPEAPTDGCFSLWAQGGRVGSACASDAEEARDWAEAVRLAPCS